ncbi:MAG: hypothetical protein ACF8PN_07895 [Phycisphaerales bacterium]
MSRFLNPLTTERDAASATGAVTLPAPDCVALDRVVLLAGGLKPSPLMAASGMSTLDLPLDRGGRSLVERWRRQIVAAQPGGRTRTSFILAESSAGPRSERAREVTEADARFTMTDDPGLRGPAGAVRDLSDDLDDNATILIVEAMRYSTSDLSDALTSAARGKAEVTVFRHDDDRPAGLYLTTARMLRLIADEGFIDIKEQWLQAVLGRGVEVRVVEMADGYSLPVRTLEDAIAVAYSSHPAAEGMSPVRRFATQTETTGDAGAFIDPTAEIHSDAITANSIIAADAIIEADALVVRSVIGAGAVVSRGTVVVDRVVKRGERVR